MDLGNYLELRPLIKTGDLLGVSGSGIVSRLIRWRTKSVWSHVGMFVEGGGDWILLLHSTAKYGVAEVPAFRYLQELKGSAALVQLDRQEAERRNPQYLQHLLEARRDVGRHYDFKGVAHYLLPWVSQTKASRYCSELIATVMQRAKLIDSTEISPDQLISCGLFKSPVWLD